MNCKFRLDLTAYCRVSCPLAFEKIPILIFGGGEKNFVETLEPVFLIRSFSLLQATRTTIKPWMSSDFGGIPPLTLELAALEF